MSGNDWLEKFCKIQTYSFFLTDEPSIKRSPDDAGNWIEKSEAAKIIDAMRDEIENLNEKVSKVRRAETPPHISEFINSFGWPSTHGDVVYVDDLLYMMNGKILLDDTPSECLITASEFTEILETLRVIREKQ